MGSLYFNEPLGINKLQLWRREILNSSQVITATTGGTYTISCEIADDNKTKLIHIPSKPGIENYFTISCADQSFIERYNPTFKDKVTGALVHIGNNTPSSSWGVGSWLWIIKQGAEEEVAVKPGKGRILPDARLEYLFVDKADDKEVIVRLASEKPKKLYLPVVIR